VFSKKPYEVGSTRYRDNRVFKHFFVHDEKAIIYNGGPKKKNDRMVISLIPLLHTEEGVDHRWANEVKFKIDGNTNL
jgi:hypothetical protein